MARACGRGGQGAVRAAVVDHGRECASLACVWGLIVLAMDRVDAESDYGCADRGVARSACDRTSHVERATCHAIRVLPARTAVVIFIGHSDPRRMASLNARKFAFESAIRSGKKADVSVVSFAGSGKNEAVQVQDMDFELVKPSIPRVTGKVSQDSTLTGRDVDTGKLDTSPILGNAASMYSSAPRSPLFPTHATATLPNLLVRIGNAN